MNRRSRIESILAGLAAQRRNPVPVPPSPLTREEALAVLTLHERLYLTMAQDLGHREFMDRVVLLGPYRYGRVGPDPQ